MEASSSSIWMNSAANHAGCARRSARPISVRGRDGIAGEEAAAGGKGAFAAAWSPSMKWRPVRTPLWDQLRVPDRQVARAEARPARIRDVPLVWRSSISFSGSPKMAKSGQ